jgi:hypothetical protein
MNWISVDERLPPNGQRVLLYRIDCTITVGYFVGHKINKEVWRSHDLMWPYQYPPTHWMPIPDPPVMPTPAEPHDSQDS